MTDTPFLIVDRLSKRFSATSGVRDLSLGLSRGEILALLGPSGSGKTTTLRLLAGFETADQGRIVIGGDDVTGLVAVKRRIGMVFQHYALFPHLTVGGNVGFGLVETGVRAPEIARRVAHALEAVDLQGFQDRSVSSLSGGQQQRVALARALAPEPRILLLDEPLSNLDPALRERTRRELRQLIQRIGITTVLVTHEQEEAFDLADRIAVLNRGMLDQLGTPESLYHDPATPFVASFIGRASLLPGTSSGSGPSRQVELGSDLAPLEAPAGLVGQVTVACRPEAFRFEPAGRWRGRVVDRRFLGSAALYRVALAPGLEIEVVGGPGAASVGDSAAIEQTGVGVHLFAAGTDPQ
jgi:iron(III) transport system ATP-binding protein